MGSDLDRHEQGGRKLEEVRRHRSSPVYKSSEEFQIEREMETLGRRIWPNRFSKQSQEPEYGTGEYWDKMFPVDL